MSRLEKKCLIASASMHGLLLLVLVMSVAFLKPPDEVPDLPVLTLIPDKLTDDPFYGGAPASPAPESPQAEPPPRLPEPALEPDKPKPEPKPEPAPPKSTEVKTPDPTPPKRKPTEKPPAKQRPKITPSLEKVQPSRDASQTQRELQQQYQAKVRDLASNLARKLSSGTKIDIPGPGREAYANYSQIVRSMYFRAWVAPAEMAGSSAVVETRVEIARNGTVLSAAITRESGDPVLDASVRRALQLNFIAPFPEGAKDSKRVFIIDFTLRPE